MIAKFAYLNRLTFFSKNFSEQYFSVVLFIMPYFVRLFGIVIFLKTVENRSTNSLTKIVPRQKLINFLTWFLNNLELLQIL